MCLKIDQARRFYDLPELKVAPLFAGLDGSAKRRSQMHPRPKGQERIGESEYKATAMPLACAYLLTLKIGIPIWWRRNRHGLQVPLISVRPCRSAHEATIGRQTMNNHREAYFTQIRESLAHEVKQIMNRCLVVPESKSLIWCRTGQSQMPVDKTGRDRFRTLVRSEVGCTNVAMIKAAAATKCTASGGFVGRWTIRRECTEQAHESPRCSEQKQDRG